MDFFPTNDNQDGRQKMAAVYQFASIVVTLTESLLIGFLPNFIYGLLPLSDTGPMSKDNRVF